MPYSGSLSRLADTHYCSREGHKYPMMSCLFLVLNVPQHPRFETNLPGNVQTPHVNRYNQ